MNSEQAYEQIARAMLTTAKGARWTTLVLEANVYDHLVSGRFVMWNNDEVDESRYVPSPSSRNVLEAALFLRDELLATSGERITGFTFTLQLNGKFNIDYRYGELKT